MTGYVVTHVAALLIASRCIGVESHGRLLDPPSRASGWRQGVKGLNINYNDNQLYCGGFQRQWKTNGGQCGICGDPYDGPRDHEAGGKYATGVITRDYLQADVIHVQVQLTAHHMGWFEFRICPNNDVTRPASQSCLDRHVLAEVTSLRERTRFDVTTDKGPIYDYYLQLPSDLTCSQCVLQWKYNTGNSWGVDQDTGYGCVGCGPQEQFYGCADVSIAPRESDPETTLGGDGGAATTTQTTTAQTTTAQTTMAQSTTAQTTTAQSTTAQTPAMDSRNTSAAAQTTVDMLTSEESSKRVPVTSASLSSPEDGDQGATTAFENPGTTAGQVDVTTSRENTAAPTTLKQSTILITLSRHTNTPVNQYTSPIPKTTSTKATPKTTTTTTAATTTPIPKSTPISKTSTTKATSKTTKATTTTTTTARTTTTVPDKAQSGCRAASGPWMTVPGMDSWCVMNCAYGFCPPSHCTCD